LRVFRPTGATRCIDVVKFGFGPLLKFHRQRCNDKAIGPQNWKFCWIFSLQLSEYKRRLRDFHEICRFVPRSMMQHLLKFEWIFSSIVTELWGFQFEGRISGRNCASDPQQFSRCKNVLKVLYRRARLVRPWAAKDVEFLVCLSVCSSRFWTTEFLLTISPWSCWSIETVLMPSDRRRFVVEHPCSTFSDCRQLATPEKLPNQKVAKFGNFRRQRAIK